MAKKIDTPKNAIFESILERCFFFFCQDLSECYFVMKFCRAYKTFENGHLKTPFYFLKTTSSGIHSYPLSVVVVQPFSFSLRRSMDNITIPAVLHAHKFILITKNAHSYFVPKSKIFQSLHFSKEKTGVSPGDLLNRGTVSAHHHFTNHTAFSICCATLA